MPGERGAWLPLAVGLILSLLPWPALAQAVVRGVDVVRPIQFSESDQDAQLAQLEAAGIHVGALTESGRLAIAPIP